METPVPTLEGRTLRAELLLSAAPQVVRDYIADLQHLERWWPEHKRYRRMSGDGGPGTRYYWIFVGSGAILPGFTRVEALTPDLLVYRTSMGGLPIRMRYEFSPAGAGTRLRIEMNCAGLRWSLFARTTRKQLTAALSHLAAVFAPAAQGVAING